MKIKTYTATQLGSALAQIKKELGEDALILSTKEIEIKNGPGGQPVMGFEVVAAGESPGLALPASASRQQPAFAAAPREPAAPAADPLGTRNSYAPLPASRRPAPPPAGQEPRPEPVLRIGGNPPVGATLPPPQAQAREDIPALPPVPQLPALVPVGGQEEEIRDFLRGELRELKRLVRWSAQSVAGARLRLSEPAADALFVEMIANDLDEALARRIIAEAQSHCKPGADKAALENESRKALQGMISVQPWNEKSKGQIIAAFLGPTGVGKSTTIAKLASLFALEHRKRTLLITLDTYRIGAAEQLTIYADLIGIPLVVASTAQEISRALQENQDMDVVLIDTVGRAHNRLNPISSLTEYLRSEARIEKHLVLSLTTKPLDLHEIVNSFQVFGIDKLLFTKLDETLTSGPAANELVRTRLPLSYLTNGQNVPQDIRIPTPESFAEQIIARDIHAERRQAYA